MESKIQDRFIKELVFPNENILCWVKYKKSIEFDNFAIICEDPDIGLHDFQFKNLLKSVIIEDKKGKGSLIKEYRKNLILDGFIGFECKYKLIKSNSVSVIFHIDFYLGGKIIESVKFQTKIIRPIIKVKFNETPEVMTISAFSPNVLPTLLMEIKNDGLAEAINVSLNCISTNPKIKIKLNHIEQKREIEGFFKDTIIKKDFLLEISGKGYSLVKLNLNYEDEIGNKYQSIIYELPIFSEYEKITKKPLKQIQEEPTIMIKI